MNANKLSCGLFMLHGKNWWRNLKDIPIFIHRIFFTLKHGYSPVATFETFEWFIAVMREVLTFHRHNRMGTPIVIENYFGENYEERQEENETAYNAILDEMLSLLNEMDDNNPDNKKNAAKDKFFKLFSEQFYNLWD